MERTYLPWRNWGDLPYAAKGGLWQHQRHIYLMPFYYIDYVLAQTCALQFWVRAETRPRRRHGRLRGAVPPGRRRSLPELAASAGLTSPFDDGCLAEVVDAARAVLFR